MPFTLRSGIPVLLVSALASTALAEDRLTFEEHVRPVLKAYCLDCHGAEEDVKGSLDLRLKRFAEKGGDSGPAIVVGNPEESLLVERMKSGEMPPTETKVPADQIALIERWIAQGAVTTRTEPESLPAGIDITPEERAYWFYQPIRSVEPPAYSPTDPVQTPIDAFLLAKLREKSLTFAPAADRRTLIRRVSLDLTGLPPDPKAVEEFVSDPDPAAYEKLIDRLLDSPHYGERWARHWLDVAGYADSEGDGTTDTVRPHAWKYRDYVVRALNSDKPLDQFIIEQLAGDELLPRPATNLTPEQVDLLAATGFLRMAADPTASGGNIPENSNQVIADSLKIVGSTLYGLTIGCAQCHDHRYDPIPQVDYFRLRAVFEPAWNVAAWKRPEGRLVSLLSDAQRAEWAKFHEVEKIRLAEIAAKEKEWIDKIFEEELKKFPEAEQQTLRTAFQTAADQRTPEQKKLVETTPKLKISPGVIYQYNQAAADEINKMREALAAERAKLPPPDFAHALLEEPGVSIQTKVFYRGDYRQPKQAVLPGDLTIAAPEGSRFEIPGDDPQLPTTGRRLALAKHLTNGQHPLVGRVLVNRIWLHHFGRGLVDTPGDFGFLGVLPTHPELLDWLATELVRRNWSLKAMHRLIMTSTVYRQSSSRDPAKDAIDSDNALYGRFSVRRLEAETLRDQILAVSGRLNRSLFGPAIAVSEDFVGQVLPADDSPRRSLYLQVRRSKPVSFLAAFDAPLMAVNCDRRVQSTGAPQSLMLMNSEFVLSNARTLAMRLRAEPATQSELPAVKTESTVSEALLNQTAAAWRAVYQRAITAEELQLAGNFLADQMNHQRASGMGGDLELSALTNLCHQLLNSNEFLYVD